MVTDMRSIGGEDGATTPSNVGGADAFTQLPNDVFLLIVSFLSSQDCIVCRRVSSAWRAAFAADDVSRTLMRWHFPRARELRMASDSVPSACDYTAMFDTVARRYHHLRAAKPSAVEKVDVRGEARGSRHYIAVEPWDRVLRFNEHEACFQYRDAAWTLDDGLLVYGDGDGHGGGRWVAYDLETRRRFVVPFDGSDKTVRRLRLSCSLLVVEWAEREPYHLLNGSEAVHRHFATAFDVRRSASEVNPSGWNVTFRAEWKIHFLGLPVSTHDRFFSAHSNSHYAVYIWQPNRHPWGEEDPLEQLTVWDITCPSTYRPSLDPAASHKPDAGPVVLHRFTARHLDFLGLRQRHTPSLREILVDETNVYVHEEDHRWLAGPHSSLSPSRHHQVRCTGIPFTGVGPSWFDDCCADGDVHMSFCPRAGSVSRLVGSSGDRAPSPGAGLAPCWRHEEFPYLTVCDMVDRPSGIRIVARQCFVMEVLSVFVPPRISLEEGEGEDAPEVRFADDMWGQLLAKGRLCGDERWLVGEDNNGMVTILRF